MDKMVHNLLIYLKIYNIDGFDYDWEFPTWSLDSDINDRQKFPLLLKVKIILFFTKIIKILI